MNEIYSNEANELKFYCRVKTNLVEPEEMPMATLILPDREVPLSVREDAKGVYSVPVRSQDVQTKAARVEFRYSLPDHGEIIETQRYEITRRLISYDEMVEVLSEDLKYKEYTEIERTARGVIEAHCRQPFNYWFGSNIVVGNDGVIMMPQYLDRLEYVEKRLSEVDVYHISFPGDGFEITAGGMAVQNIECLEQQKYMSARPRQSDYLVKGQWGYETVPMPVKQAAMLIVQNKLCPSGTWHENYIDNLRSDNMRIQYNPASYDDSTGIYDADLLLADYRNITMGAI